MHTCRWRVEPIQWRLLTWLVMLLWVRLRDPIEVGVIRMLVLLLWMPGWTAIVPVIILSKLLRALVHLVWNELSVWILDRARTMVSRVLGISPNIMLLLLV